MRLLSARLAVSVCCGFVFVTGTEAAAAFQLTTLHSFGSGDDGKVPEAAPLLGHGHNLYGTTAESGAYGTCGTVFRLAPDGTETQLHVFDCADAGVPEAPLISDGSGNLYGTAYSYGADRLGGVFEITAGGVFSILHTFTGISGDGANPGGALLEDRNGNFYGTTNYGGGAQNAGIVFRMNGSGSVTPLYTFSGGSDGANSNATLIADKAGNLYGTAQRGGSMSCSSTYGPGCGVVFKLSPKGKETVLHTFAGGTDGIWPQSGLVADAAGNMYGTTIEGGIANGCVGYGCGTVYRITPKGDEQVLYAFQGGDDGLEPNASLLVDGNGNLYGTASHGGANGDGTVFKISAKGRFSVLYTFTGGNDGAGPYAGLTADKQGNLFGTTLYGGEYDYGVVFKLMR